MVAVLAFPLLESMWKNRKPNPKWSLIKGKELKELALLYVVGDDAHPINFVGNFIAFHFIIF